MKKQRVDVANANVVARTDYGQTLTAIVEGGFCPFCEEHFFKHHREPIIYRGRHWLVTKNSWPYEGTQHHFLFVARAHIEKTEKLTAEMWAEFHVLYRKVIKTYRLTGATLMMRSGDTAITGATVNHIHAQLIIGSPRTSTTMEPIKALVGFK